MTTNSIQNRDLSDYAYDHQIKSDAPFDIDGMDHTPTEPELALAGVTASNELMGELRGDSDLGSLMAAENVTVVAARDIETGKYTVAYRGTARNQPGGQQDVLNNLDLAVDNPDINHVRAVVRSALAAADLCSPSALVGQNEVIA